MTPEFLSWLTDWLKMERWGLSWNPGTKVMSSNVRERKSGEESGGGGGGGSRRLNSLFFFSGL